MAIFNKSIKKNNREREKTTITSITVNEEAILRANRILNEYKKGKTNLESRIVENEIVGEVV